MLVANHLGESGAGKTLPPAPLLSRERVEMDLMVTAARKSFSEGAVRAAEEAFEKQDS
jgi:hypothetical protein